MEKAEEQKAEKKKRKWRGSSAIRMNRHECRGEGTIKKTITANLLLLDRNNMTKMEAKKERKK